LVPLIYSRHWLPTMLHGDVSTVLVTLLLLCQLPSMCFGLPSGFSDATVDQVYLGAGAGAGAVALLCVLAACRTCQRGRYGQDAVVVNYWRGCSVFGACEQGWSQRGERGVGNMSVVFDVVVDLLVAVHRVSRVVGGVHSCCLRHWSWHRASRGSDASAYPCSGWYCHVLCGCGTFGPGTRVVRASDTGSGACLCSSLP